MASSECGLTSRPAFPATSGIEVQSEVMTGTSQFIASTIGTPKPSRNDTRIRDNKMLAFEGILEGVGKHIVYKKAKIKGGGFLYSFKDAALAASEEKAFLAKAEAKKDFDPEKYAKQQERFGTIVFESDADLPPKVIYECYEERWLLELVFAQYKGDECLDKTRVQGDFSVIDPPVKYF